MSDEEAIKYVKQNNCWDAYINKRADLRFDPKQRRVVFLIKDSGDIVDAAGRSLSPSIKPKWYRYSNSRYPFTCGNGDTAALVEDGASACAVSSIMAGVALLGTTLKDTFLSPLQRFRKVLICLDKDASKKSIEMHRVLSYYVDVEVRLLEDDLKYLTAEQIQKTLMTG